MDNLMPCYKLNVSKRLIYNTLIKKRFLGINQCALLSENLNVLCQNVFAATKLLRYFRPKHDSKVFFVP